MSRKINHIKRNAAFVSFLALALALGLMPQARADDDPFQTDNGRWMSFDHYNDGGQHGAPAPAATAAPDAHAADSGAADAAKPVQPPAQPQIVASPARPIELPVMPGVNKGYAVQINSTEDAASKAELVIPAPDSSGVAQPSDLRLADRNWQSPQTMQTSTQLDENGAPYNLPINVRLSLLPDKNVTPSASPEHASAQQAGHIEMRKIIQARLARQQRDNAKDKAAGPTPAQTAAQAALDAYKKQQLDAIEGDRQTLKALQDAVHSLGLEKQLDFMTGATGKVNAQDTSQSQTTVR